jgi:uncharacterized protein YyaL (SSP411 family)
MRYALLLVSILLAACASRPVDDLGYHPDANPLSDLKTAKSEAAAKHKKVLVIAGGSWCRWCHKLEHLIRTNKDVQRDLGRTFEVVKVYIADKNDNADFFEPLPKAAGYPHFWVLSSGGEVLASVDTSMFIKKQDDYDKKALQAFIAKHAKR